MGFPAARAAAWAGAAASSSTSAQTPAALSAACAIKSLRVYEPVWEESLSYPWVS